MNQTKKLDARYHRMLIDLVYEGMTTEEVSVRYGVTQQMIATHRKSDSLWIESEAKMMEEMRKSYQSQLAALVPDALLALKDHLAKPEQGLGGIQVSVPPQVRHAAAKLVLERADIGRSEDASRNVQINLFGPGWMNNNGESKPITVDLSGGIVKDDNE